MRLKTLSVSGFRGFAAEQTFDLDADAVIVIGPNGSGKTSLFDAVLWALTGSVQRLSSEPGDVVSRYSLTGEARVELELELAGATTTIVRRFDGRDNLSLVDDEVGSVTGAAAETGLIDLLWPAGRSAADPKLALSRSLTRAMYLQQDVVREFVDSDDDEARFNVISELVGVGRVTELQRALENSRKTWSEATNNLKRELDSLEGQISELENTLGRLSASDGSGVPEVDFEAWLSALDRVVRFKDQPPSRHRTSEWVDRVMPVLQALQRRDQRSGVGLEELLQHLETPRPQAIDAGPLELRVQELEALVAHASEQLQLAQEAAASERRRQAELRDSAESLKALAQLALRHLAEECPVCAQQYDVDATRARLEELANGSSEPAESVQVDPVSDAAAELEERQRELAAEQARLRDAEGFRVARERWDRLTESLAAAQGLADVDDRPEAARQRLGEVQVRQSQIQSLLQTGENFSLQLAREAEIAQRTEVDARLTSVRQESARRDAEIQARLETHQTASNLIVALRGASNAIVSDELARIAPLLQRIYSSVDPHPSLRAVDFLTRERRGHGRLWTTLTDQPERKTVEDPSLVLSSSQLNVLAVSTFLALNLAIDSLPLQAIILDDPLQSLDTINLLGLADLLRRVRATRQTIVSTHDPRLAQLLARKLRPAEGGRTRVIRLDAWGRRGPVVDQSDVPADSVPLKLVASA